MGSGNLYFELPGEFPRTWTSECCAVKQPGTLANRVKAIEAPGREPSCRSHRELLRELEQNQPLWPAGGSPKVVQIRELDCDYDGPSIA